MDHEALIRINNHHIVSLQDLCEIYLQAREAVEAAKKNKHACLALALTKIATIAGITLG